jgi:hypothetical protein
MAERLVSELTHDGVSYDALSTAGPAPRIMLKDMAFDHSALRVQVLTDGFEAKLVEAAEPKSGQGGQRQR